MSLSRNKPYLKKSSWEKEGKVLCVVVGCSSESGKHKGFKLFRIPKVITNQGEEQEKLTTRRRNERVSTVS